MLSCGHDAPSFGFPLCEHLRTCRTPYLSYFRWYIGEGLDRILLCQSCVGERERGRAADAESVCEPCYVLATQEVGNLYGSRGRPSVRTRGEPLAAMLESSPFPATGNRIVDLAPIESECWLFLDEQGALIRFDARTLDATHVGTASVPSESDREPWDGHPCRPRLHAAPDGEFAAVVNDFGTRGQLIDLRSGRVTLELHGGDDNAETVPFSFAFARVQGRTVAIHRTDWNRLDVSDPATGELLTRRAAHPTYASGEQTPEHYLDYFHGALYVSPGGSFVLDDGWCWHPVGVPTIWSLERWLASNVWESEDGPSRRDVCARDYWNRAFTWIDDRTLAVNGISDDEERMIEGARIFDVTSDGESGHGGEGGWRRAVQAPGPTTRYWPRLLSEFAGPSGTFFSDGVSLFSSDAAGLSRWDPRQGVRTGHVPGFEPTHHHRAARQLAQLAGDTLLRWRIP